MQRILQYLNTAEFLFIQTTGNNTKRLNIADLT